MLQLSAGTVTPTASTQGSHLSEICLMASPARIRLYTSGGISQRIECSIKLRILTSGELGTAFRMRS